MTGTVRFTLDGQRVEAQPQETIWQIAQRLGNEIPHLCYAPQPDYRADGNCRLCMVEIEGERALAASCIRTAREGMVVNTANARAKNARRMVMELLVADQPPRDVAHEHDSRLWRLAEYMEVTNSRFPRRTAPPMDNSHPAMQVNLDACIHCNLCVRACGEVQVNEVIDLAYRGHHAKIVFDFDDPMGQSTCVACGECVQACPTGALRENTLVDSNGRDRRLPSNTVDSVCPYCGVGCQIRYHVHQQKIIAVDGRDGPANRNRLCVKGRFGFDYVAHPQRLTVPLIRRHDAPKDGAADLDPSHPETHFRVASWAEALDCAAAGFRRILELHGSRSLAGFGSAKGSNEEAYLVQKLVRQGFGSNNVDHCTRLCHASSVAALLEGIGSAAVTAPFTACEDAEVIIIIGANPTENHPVAATFFKQAAQHATLIVMDPRGQAMKRHATHMLQFTPGTDVALLNAMLHVIINEGLYNRDYIASQVNDFAKLQAHVVDFPPQAMAPICGIDAATIVQVARAYAMAKKAIIFWGMGISQHVHGTDNARCLIALALITGHLGRDGTGLHPLRGQNNVQGASDAGLIPMLLPDYQALDQPQVQQHFANLWQCVLDPQPGLTVVEIMDSIHVGGIKGMYIMGENPAMSDPDAQHARLGLATLSHLVVQDIFFTETAWHADVILPASAWPEKDGTVTNTNRQIQMGRRALPLPGDARQDWWIIQQLAQRLGLNWHYSGPAEVFAEMKQVMGSLDHITWDRLASQSAVTYPCKGSDKIGQAIVFGEGFPTADGKGRVVTANLIPPDEKPDAEFPLVLTTGRQLEHWHTGAMTRRAEVLDQLEPQAIACLSTAQLQKLQLSAGRMIRVCTRRGVIELLARADNAVPEGMIFVPFCYAEAAANTLTNPALDPFGKIPEYKYCAARVEASTTATPDD